MKCLAAVIAACAVAALVGVVNRGRKKQKAGWQEVETMDDPREYCATEGASFFGFGSKPARRS